MTCELGCPKRAIYKGEERILVCSECYPRIEEALSEEARGVIQRLSDALEAAEQRAVQAEAELRDTFRTDIPSLKDQRDALTVAAENALLWLRDERLTGEQKVSGAIANLTEPDSTVNAEPVKIAGPVDTTDLDLPGATRLEVIGSMGRIITRRNLEPGMQILVQDGARTVKVFIQEGNET